MARYTQNEAATVPAINTELEKIELAIQDTLSRKGDVPNIMEAPIDMNSNRVINLPLPIDDHEPARKVDLGDYISTVTGLLNQTTAEANRAEEEADDAAASASAALASETAADISEAAALASQIAAAASEAQAEDLFDQFDDRFLGVKTSDPSTDNDGDALLTGALYFNSVLDRAKVYTGTAWVEVANTASSAAAAASAGEAAASAAAALASELAAADSATDADNSFIAAQSEATDSAASAALSLGYSVNSLNSANDAALAQAAAELAQDYLEGFLFHYIEDDTLSVTVGIGTQVLVSESTTGYDSVLLELSVA